MARGMLSKAVRRARVTKVAPTWTQIATSQLLRDDYFLVIDDDYCFPIVWNDGKWEAKTCLARGRFE